MDRKQFEEWFKTTLSYAIFEDSNVWKVDLYASNEPTNSYLHSGVQAAFESYQHQQAKVEELQLALEKQGKLALSAIENAKNGSLLELREAEKLKSESSPEILESERAMNAQLTEENLRLEGHLEELQKRVDAALKETQFALQYVEEDMRGNHEFLQMAMIRTFKALEQVLNGGEPK